MTFAAVRSLRKPSLGSRPLRTIGTIAVVTAALALTACGGGGKKQAASTSAMPTPTPTTSAMPTPTPTPAPTSPFNGLTASKNGVVAVKIDDTGNGRPQVNINKADVVYIEEVEGGLTRLLAVFNSQLPTVEPVRSTRAADPELVAQYGPIAYVASGGAHVPLAYLHRSPLKTSINDAGGPGFARDGSRPAPYNLSANLATIAKKLKAPQAKSIGFTFAAAAPTSSTPGTAVHTQVGGTNVDFKYNAKTGRYVRYINGVAQKTAGGASISTPNVIVQFCKVTQFNADRDVLGNPNQYTHSIGTGKVVVFRDGKRIVGTWKRPTATSGTQLVDSAGKPIPLKPGGEWVVLTRTNAPLAAG